MSRTGASGRQPFNGGSTPTRVVLLDAQALVREGLRLLLDREPDIDVVGEASSVEEARELDADVDVVVSELELADGRGPELFGALRALWPAASIVALTLADHPTQVVEAVAAGADGYLRKTATVPELLDGVRTVARGERYLQPALGVELARWHGVAARGLGPGGPVEAAGDALPLSARERDVLRLVAMGHTNAEIGGLLAMSLRTVEAHRGRILHKLGRRTRAELVRYAHEVGLVATPAASA